MKLSPETKAKIISLSNRKTIFSMDWKEIKENKNELIIGGIFIILIAAIFTFVASALGII